MAQLIQANVLKSNAKYLENKKDDIVIAYNKFQKTLGNPEQQQRIFAKDFRETKYQDGFLREIFVDLFGYLIDPTPNYNMSREQRPIVGASRMDGAIFAENSKTNIIGVIELKDTKTKTLQEIEKQAFDYHFACPNSRYIITSNFQYLRLYIDSRENYEDFHLFKLSFEDFKRLYLYLHRDFLQYGITSKLRTETIEKEKEITNKFYDHYKLFRNVLLKDILAWNSKKYDKQLLVKKTQKLLDRLLFIFFSEDRGLIKAKTSIAILDEWTNRTKENSHIPLYDYFKSYFGYLNKGFESKHYGKIHAYNGGLFAPDEILDNLKIFDNVLDTHVRAIEAYDFVSELNANILGHIFEQSLNDMEEVTAIINGIDFDKKKSKRKKDGIFYTPTYITKYIVAHTVGALCREKETELGLNDEKRLTLKGVQAYREWLLALTVIDPACGSGAFLNEVLDFFIAEHRHIDELEANVKGTLIDFKDYSDQILSNNIFGVDINEESVEIAQLSLWLHTAKAGRKLVTLNKNIQCGNSLISDPKVAGDKAFDWKKAFPTVFKNGGFDVVLGNPPYVDIKAMDTEVVKHLFAKFKTTENRINLYSIFIEKGYDILKDKGYLSFINPNSILLNSSYTKIRDLLRDDMTRIVKLPDNVFPDAKVETIIFELQKKSIKTQCSVILYEKDEIMQNIDDSRIKLFDKKSWKDNFSIYASDNTSNLLSKIEENTTPLSVLADFTLGITPYDKYRGHSPILIEERQFHSKTKINDTYKPLITGENVVRYLVKPNIGEYIKYGDWLGAMREERFFTEPRIIIRQIVSGNPLRIFAGYTDEALYFTQIGFSIITKDNKKVNTKYLLSLINSKLINHYHKYQFLDIEKNLFQKILIANCKAFPIKVISEKEQKPFIDKVETMLKSQKDLQDLGKKFEKRLNGDFKGVKMNKIMEQWHSLDFYDFKKEVEKQTRPMLPNEKTEWIEVLEDFQTKAKVLLKTIQQTDAAIDKAVYALYELNAAEIEIIEKQ